jgi:hypothetical protein
MSKPIKPIAILIIIAVPLIFAGILLEASRTSVIPTTEVASPSGMATAIKKYGPSDDASWIDVGVRNERGLISHLFPLISESNPTGVINEDGVTFGWDGDQHLTIGWPHRAAGVTGPNQAGDVRVSYRSYDPVLSNTPSTEMTRISLKSTSINFREEDGQAGGRYAATGKAIPEIKCIVELSGIDGSIFGRIRAEFIGDGLGSSADAGHSFGGAGIRITLEPLSDGTSPKETVTGAEISGVFPQNDLASAPHQGSFSVYYKSFTRDEALKIFSSIRQGNTNLIVALNFGDKVLNYDVPVPFNMEIAANFNECSQKTNIYGGPFLLPLD